MENGIGDQGIVGVIRALSSQRASGQLQVNAGITGGSLLFNQGQLVDARLGKLNGFQAINALASMRDATYNFDPAVAPPTQSSITANERLLLKDFFGIEADDPKSPREVHISWPNDPAPVIPLAELEEQEHVNLQSSPPDFVNEQIAEPVSASDVSLPQTPSPVRTDEVTFVKRQPVATARSPFRPALFLIILFMIVAAAVIAVVYRNRRADSTVSVVPTSQSPSPAETQTVAKTEQVSADVPDLSGNWKVINTVERTSYEPYQNMEVGFAVSIDQKGTEFTGRGEKISENGRTLSSDSRTPITVKGTIDGDQVKATFSEQGAIRTTNGRFVWRIDKASGRLIGQFVSTAARARGKSAATRA
jgi:hypothetical protein